MTTRHRRARAAVAGLAIAAVAAVPALGQLPATAEDAPRATSMADPDAFVTLGDTVASPAGFPDITSVLDADGDVVRVAPTSAQRAAAAALGAGVRTTWNDSGTPATILPASGTLGRPAGRGPSEKARAWVAANRVLLGLTAAQAGDLELVSDQPLAGGGGHAVLLRQRLGGLTPATRGLVTVAVAPDGGVAFVSSSLARVSGSPAAARLSPLEGWLEAAAAVGRTGIAASAVDVFSRATTAAGAPGGEWTRLRVPGLDQVQLARLRGFARPDGSVVPVVEANVVDTTGGTPFAFRVLVDAVDGSVLFRQNAVENSSDAFPFTGTYTATDCSQPTPFALTDAETRTIAVVAAAVVPTDDITVKITSPSGVAQESDLLTSPEAATFTSADGFAAGTWTAQVCSFSTANTGGPFAGTILTSDSGAGAGGAGDVLPQPAWRAFTANPALSTLEELMGFSPDTSVVECWRTGTAGCAPGEAHENLFSLGAWDTLGGLPTFTTLGNNATTREAWASPLTPGGLAQAPVSPTRQYTKAFTDAWNNSGCNPANLVPGGNDIDAVTTNLFVGHNRIHDFSYALGFTERTYNLQVDNRDRGGVGGDPEIGNVQAGALIPATDPTGQLPVTGRDNANQIALQDGVPGITNQYLFQPLAAAFYSPCADGSLDTGIYGHEYTHAITNRMVGGPDDDLTSEHGGAMGESWSDLVAAEYEFENGYLRDARVAANPWALGAYATGNGQKGIRDYGLNDNPLNFSDYGFDTTGPEVHADGEIWNGTMWEVRQALVDRWDAAGFRYADTGLQQRCEQPAPVDTTRPQLGAEACPGNRRWLQLMFDSFLLQQGATDMLQARDAFLAADRMRFGGANQALIWGAFARRGMGADASTPTPDSEDVTASFRSPLGQNSAVTFTSASPGSVYVGRYEARATPVATTNVAGKSPTATFTPGVYRMTFVSPTSGFRRFVLTVPDTGLAFGQPIDDAAVNVAAAASGATVADTTTGSLNAGALIDGTEASNWSGTAGGSNVDDASTPPSVTVDLAGTAPVTLTSAKVSALLRPSDPDPDAPPVPLLRPDDVVTSEADPLAGSRFTALRKFALEACTSACDDPASFTRFYTSPDDAFPGDVPRPVAPDQTMRSFTFPAVQASAVRLVALENQCTGQAAYAEEQDQDPLNATDCKTASERGQVVHASELQLFAGPVPADPAEAPAGDGSPGSGTAGQGTNALPLPGQATLATTAATTATSTQSSALRTKVRIRLPRVQQVRGEESTPMKFAVVSRALSARVPAAGRAVVRLDGKKVKKVSVSVGPRQKGKVVGRTYRVPRSLAYGKHRLRVTFKTAQPTRFTTSRSRTVTLTVVRTRPNVGR